jgi:hypothetical protein
MSWTDLNTTRKSIVGEFLNLGKDTAEIGGRVYTKSDIDRMIKTIILSELTEVEQNLIKQGKKITKNVALSSGVISSTVSKIDL